MKRRDIWLAATIVGLVPLGAMQAGAETLAVFTKSSGNPVARAVRAGAEQVAKANGWTVFNYIPTSPDNANQQTGLVDAMLRDKRDAVVFTPVDVKVMVPAVQKINAAGLPLVNVTDKIAGGMIDAFVNTDDYSIALDTARVLLKAMDGKGNLVVLDGPDNIPTAAGRARGFKDALKEFPNIKVTLSKNAQYARPVSKDLFAAMLKLSAPPPVDGVLAANDAMALGVIEAYKEAKRKPPMVVGINASKEAVDMIKSGDMLASGDYTGHIDGCIGAEIAIKLLHKEQVPKEVTAKSVVVDKSNFGPYEIPVERRMCPTLASLAAR
jgi:ribose transport system substrate-binding protein